MEDLFLVVALYAKAGKEDALRRDLIELVEPSRRDAGNLRYELFVDQKDPRRFLFLEHWASRDERQKHHTANAHIQEFHAHGAANVERTEIFYELSRLA